ncbi:hypothetical protein J2736_004903 [Paenibacillus qinlingensis]|uniref:SLH domain-containing protein n=2 Tax=Paenibacillus qinlingensis TaxID=1837343 RepID=A0ABU1P1R9_9BACL|nr:hypothetical protein [Paenibacillus qinlingensis]
MAGANLGAYKAGTFNDVKADSYYAQAVQWASENGITSGVRAGEFAPEANISREQMVTMIARFAALQKFSLRQVAVTSAFADSAEIPNLNTYSENTISHSCRGVGVFLHG